MIKNLGKMNSHKFHKNSLSGQHKTLSLLNQLTTLSRFHRKKSRIKNVLSHISNLSHGFQLKFLWFDPDLCSFTWTIMQKKIQYIYIYIFFFFFCDSGLSFSIFTKHQTTFSASNLTLFHHISWYPLWISKFSFNLKLITKLKMFS